MNLPSKRLTYFLGLLLVLLALSVGYYLEYYDGVSPCPLCMFQRICFSVLGILFLLGSLFNPGRVIHFILTTFGVIVSTLGMVLAGRQVYLQHLPSVSGGDCSASLDYMLQVLPITEVIKRVFIGGVECSQVAWRLLGLSLAEWSLIAFAFLFVMLVFQLVRGLSID